MIDDGVQHAIADFIELWHDELSLSPFLELDSTWPSISIVDLFMTPVWAAESPNSDQQQLMRHACAYISMILHDCWSAYESDVSVTMDATAGVILRAVEGRYLPENSSYTINFEQELASLYQSAPDNFPVFRDFTRHLSLPARPAALFSLGVLCGLSSAGQGEWKSLNAEELMPHILNMAQALALQCAAHYSRLFPDEPLGTYPELYMKNLVFPPLFMGEVYPAERALRGIMSFAAEQDTRRNELLQLSKNLSQFSDELISTGGLALYAALEEEEPDDKMKALLALRGPELPIIRARALQLREIYEIGGNWVELPEEEALLELDRERRLGLLPYVLLPLSRIMELKRDQSGRQLLALLCSGQMKRAEYWFSQVAVDPNDFALLRQRWLIELINGSVTPTELAHTPVAGSAEGEPMAAYLTGLTFLVHQNPAAAAKYFFQAIEGLEEEHWMYPSCAENLVEALTASGSYEEVLKLVGELHLAGFQTPATLLAEHRSLKANARPGEALVVRHQLVELCPYDRSVFSRIILPELD